MICFFIEGGFDAWTKWSTCTKLCGGGTQDRARVNTCTKEVQTERQNCNIQPCTSSVTVSTSQDDFAWSKWSECSVSCGEGVTVNLSFC